MPILGRCCVGFGEGPCWVGKSMVATGETATRFLRDILDVVYACCSTQTVALA